MSKFSKRLVNSLFLASLCSAAPCAAEAPRWEDHALGSTFAVGDITTADGIAVFFDCFTVPGHMPTCTGEATVMPELTGCNYDHRLWLNNINARMELAGSIGPQPDLKLLFGEYGGVINIEINGHFAIFDNFIDAHLAVLGGVKIEVVSGGFGSDCGEVILHLQCGLFFCTCTDIASTRAAASAAVAAAASATAWRRQRMQQNMLQMCTHRFDLIRPHSHARPPQKNQKKKVRETLASRHCSSRVL